MRLALISLALVSAATLSASDHELNLMIDKQLTPNITISSDKVKVDEPVSVGVRYGHDLIGLGPAQLQLQAAYRRQSTVDSQGGSFGQIKDTGLSLGLQAQWRLGMVIGAGAELRAERLKADPTGTSTTLVRPWVTGRVGMSFPTPLVQPVIGLEVAVPLRRASAGDGASLEDQVKALAPNFEIGVYGGLRF
nr:hypothetical protein [uncultured Holophaga sp.]